MLQAARGLLDILRWSDLRIANQLASNVEDGCGRATADAFLIDVAIKGFGDLLDELAVEVVDFRDGRGAG